MNKRKGPPHNDNDKEKEEARLRRKTPPPVSEIVDALTAWRVALGPLINSLASQAQILMISVKHVEELCPPNVLDDVEAIEDINAALEKIVTTIDKLRRLS